MHGSESECGLWIKPEMTTPPNSRVGLGASLDMRLPGEAHCRKKRLGDIRDNTVAVPTKVEWNRRQESVDVPVQDGGAKRPKKGEASAASASFANGHVMSSRTSLTGVDLQKQMRMYNVSEGLFGCFCFGVGKYSIHHFRHHIRWKRCCRPRTQQAIQRRVCDGMQLVPSMCGRQPTQHERARPRWHSNALSARRVTRLRAVEGHRSARRALPEGIEGESRGEQRLASAAMEQQTELGKPRTRGSGLPAHPRINLKT